MDTALIQEHLQLAEAHVASGERLISRQRQLIAELEKGGHDTAIALALLQTFEESQALHLADRDRLGKELAQSRRS